MTKTLLRRKSSLLAWACLFVLLLAGPGAWAQSRRVTGTVSDANGPIAGATVIIQGDAASGTVTNAQGQYSIAATTGQTLRFDFLGYASKEVVLGNQSVVDVTLEVDAIGLDQVVTIGYGKVLKRDLTGSVASIKADVVLASPSIDAITSLGGRVAGLDIAENVDPTKTEIRIRGNRSITAGNAPLFIIDGVQGGSYNDVNPNDIASIEVLKDASSTAIYGYQGANGVIIITTKKGQAGKTSISYNGFGGIEYLPKHPDYREGGNWLEARREAYKTTGAWSSSADDRVLFGTDAAWNAYQNNEWINFDDELMQNSFFQSHNVSASGGNDRTTARLSVGYYGNKHHYKKGKTERFTLRGNIDHKVTDWLSTGIVTQITHNVRHNSPYEGVSSGGGTRIGSGIELGKLYDANGNLNRYPLSSDGGKTGEYVNPLINGLYDYSKVNQVQGTDVMASGYLEVSPIQGLSIRTSLSANLNFDRTGSYTDGSSADRTGTLTSAASMTTRNTRFLNWDNVITYNKTAGDHSFGVTALSSWIKSMEEELGGSGTDQIVSNQLWWNLEGNAILNTSTEYKQYQTFSYAGRINYSFKDRYLLTGSVRWDGASRLTKKWDSFPSAALGWIVSEEPFMQSFNKLDYLKLRASYGVTGSAAVQMYETQSGVQSFNNAGLAFQDNPVLWYLFKQTIGNRNLGWEKTKQLDFGLDLTFFNGRLSASIDYYDSKTSGLLLQRSLPSILGQGVPQGRGRNDVGVFTMTQNIGKTRNQGVEVEINSINIQERDGLTWRTTVTFSTNKERIVELTKPGEEIIFDSRNPDTGSWMLNRPIKSYRGYILDGIWQNSEAAVAATYFRDANRTLPFAPGMVKIRNIEDLEGQENVIDGTRDYVYLGSQSPKWFAGLNNTVNYKNFDLSVYAYIRWGHWGENPLSGYDPMTGGRYTTFNYWTPERETNDFPRPDANKQFSQYDGYQAYSYIDRSFFRIKNITLGYTLPASLLRPAGISKVRAYVTGTNLWFKNKHRFMEGFDPEGLRRQFVFGLNIEF